MNAADIIKKYKLKQSAWTYKSCHGILHYFFPVGEQPLKPLKEYFGDCYTLTVFFCSNDIVYWYWRDEDMTRLRNTFLKQYKEDPEILNSFLKEWHYRLEILNNICKRIEHTDLKKLTNEDFFSLYKEFYAAYLNEYGISIGIQDAFSMKADEFLVPIFKKIIPKEKFEEYFGILTSPVDESFLTQEYHDRLKLLEKYKQGKDIQKELKEHAKKYFWIQNNYAKTKMLDEAYFLEEIKKIIEKNALQEMESLMQRIKNIKKEKERIIKELKISQDVKSVIKIIEVFGYVQDERKKYVLIANHYMDFFVKELVRRTKLERRLIEYSFIHEVPLLLQGKIDPKVLEERRKFCVVIQTLEGYEVFHGKIAEDVFYTVFEKKQQAETEVKGMIASRGKAQGRVKIIQRTHDLLRFEKGDVLVASMTRPEMIVAIEKAVAIVTDEGGITSHAAVVSREFGIPCIIGTKNATKILKDGDLIEVDAEKGIVRRI